ncbi:MAG: sugar transferase [Burkholderiales bacterium]
MLKRCFDVFVASVLLTCTLPVIIMVAALIRLTLGKPILFRQQRPGIHGRPFYLYKFRTLMTEYAADGDPLPDEQRMTKLGGLLRRLSLDEIPQLFNVLRGDMSLVGPRPLLAEYLPLYTPEQARRHEVIPGITGWAQVNGRNAITWEDKFKLDVWYVDHHTLWLDLKILGLTLLKVMRSQGVNQQGKATMSRFSGNKASQS